MLARLSGSWSSELLDEALFDGSCRVAVKAWLPLADVSPQVARPRDLRFVMGYVQKVGVRRVAQKIISRSANRAADEKLLAVGVGELLDLPDGSPLTPAATVMFIAPRHLPFQERVVLPVELVREWEAAPERLHEPFVLALLGASDEPGDALAKLAGWSRFSGVEVGEGDLDAAFDEVRGLLEEASVMDRRVHPLATPIVERSAPVEPDDDRAGAVVFGFGHFARTCLLPNIQQRFDVRCVHELDPSLARSMFFPSWAWDTSPEARGEDADADAWFIAGYHHTHAPLVVDALKRGVAAVAEKPLVTSRAQLDDLLAAMRTHQGRVFVGFHRRYAPWNEWIREDLRLVGYQPPVDYHCIVHEVRLPEHHWYNWPAVGSRLLSNGCHWIDHFLWLNDFSPAAEWRAHEGPGGQILVWIELENGALFSMTLQDAGSDRLGVRESTWVSHQGRSVQLTSTSYISEDDIKVIRQERIDEAVIFSSMYNRICEAILTEAPGETDSSVEMEWSLILSMEEVLRPGSGSGKP